MSGSEQDHRFMQWALSAARMASERGEVPVGAVLFCGEGEVFIGYNQRECRQDPIAHAEMMVLQKAAKRLGRWRLGGTLYVTLEPCAMCAGALLQARVDRLVYGAKDPKAGCCGSVVDLLGQTKFNHRIEVAGGVLEEDSVVLLRDFFQPLRLRTAV